MSDIDIEKLLTEYFDELRNTEMSPSRVDETIELFTASMPDAGPPAPQRLWTAVPALWKSLGLRELLFGVWDCAFLAVLAAALVWSGAAMLVRQQEYLVYTVLFVISPVLWAVLHGLIMWKERMSGVWELFMTARVTLRQLSALRMLLFGAVSVVASVALCGMVRLLTGGELSLLRLCGVSFASLFLFAAASLLAEEFIRPPLGCLAVPAAWLALGAALLWLGPKAERFFAGLPEAVLCLIAVIAAGIYLALLKRRCFIGKEGVAAYAVG